MSKQTIYAREVEECFSKIQFLLKEYNCKIEFDGLIEKTIVVDNDTLDYCVFGKKSPMPIQERY